MTKVRKRIAMLLRRVTSKRARVEFAEAKLRAARDDKGPKGAAREARWTRRLHRAEEGLGGYIRRLRHQRKKLKRLEKAHQPEIHAEGLTTFDGVTVAAWIAHWLQAARDSGIWGGRLVSGYRTPEYSEQLCEQMCGAPSCPGTCAGRATNHAKYEEPDGAVDVTDYINFGVAMRRLGAPLKNDLPRDRVHYSSSGH